MITQNPDYLIAIVESGSLTKAASKLYISQPSLSQYIRRLETSLGIELFDRTSSPMKLTYAGERYYRYILQMKQMEMNIREEMHQIQNETGGRIRLGIALWRGTCLIPEVFPQYHMQYPGVSLELFEGRFIQMKQALENYEIDLMIANLLQAGSYGEFETEKIMTERILLAMPAHSSAAEEALKTGMTHNGYPVIAADVLNRFPVVMTKEGQSLTEMIRSMFARENITPDILLETGNLTTAINLCAEGTCCTFVPEGGARICAREDRILFFEVQNTDLSWDLSFLYRKNSYLSAVKRNFIDCVKQRLCSF